MWERAEMVWNGLLDVVYPPCCLVCGVRLEAGALCMACQQEIQPIAPPFCDRCGVPVCAGDIVCTRCQAGPEPPFAWSQALGEYKGVLRRAIHRLKYDGKSALAEPLGHLLAQSLLAEKTPLLPVSTPLQEAFDFIVPVPLHPSRFRQRGFNQAERIARVVSRECGWQLEIRGLIRVRPTRSQTGYHLEQRAANVQGAFAASSPLFYDGKSVLLLDDVLTTTATLRECARVVREAGAKRVCIVALAHGG